MARTGASGRSHRAALSCHRVGVPQVADVIAAERADGGAVDRGDRTATVPVSGL
ncbi:MAG: hypothetical protein M3Y87_30205 [Myxococcota bacterium]|nr:hypothetical protein [Myxococcota bacterium]